MNRILSIAAMGAAFLAGGCATTPRHAPVDVTRYHIGALTERTTISVEPMSGAAQISPEYQLYADAVAAELGRLGFVKSTSDLASGYIAAVSFTRSSRGAYREPPPVSIGLGGGGISGGRRSAVGVGGGVSFGIGGKTREVYGSELSVQLRRRSDNTTVWEGRAVTESVSGKPGSDPRDQAARLAYALFRDFPGESGVTTTVK
ncbi:MAG: DUF4136 domain-containing protein [Sphingomonas sp.]|uniref:DUF4136 domain-containing protein n=1 Tax=Sphingomonas sp. TaxID=28214 RepID=UPI002272DAEC|nr:DUF4136 domain-containing protein [Sphingomonas sp.]MCX8475261.1 DUF4136 domain-containing protein [Sphingomonas sp.]